MPLLGRIMVWLLLNLLLLGGVVAVLVFTEFSLEPMLAGAAGERSQRAADALMAEIRDRPQSEWVAALDRFDEAYSVKALLVKEDGSPLVGETVSLPAEVMARLRVGGPGGPRGEETFMDLRRRGPRGEGRDGRFDGPPPGGRSDFGGPGGPGGFGGPDGPGGPPPGMQRRASGPVPRGFLRAGEPAHYWLIFSGVMPDPSIRRPVRLIFMSETLSAGGLFFDFKPWLWAGSGVLAFSVLWWMPFVRGITRSISQMTAATERIAEGRFDTNVSDRRGDEIGRLGSAINRMAQRLEGFITGQKRFLGDIAHELCSPLARMEMALGVLEQRADPSQRDYVDDVREEVRHMSGLVNELLQFSKAGLKPKDLPQVAVNVRDLAERVISREGLEDEGIRIKIPETVSALGDPELLVRALGNLVRNAIRHAGGVGPITISTNLSTPGQVLLSVIDSGPGVPPEALARLGEPFFRPDLARSRETGGTGLGLAIVKTCVEACQGKLELRNGTERGLVATLVLKRA